MQWHSEAIDPAAVSAMSPLEREQVFQIGNMFFHKAAFILQAQAAFAKSVIYCAEATQASRANSWLWATISAYYSLFHLTVSLIFVLPHEMVPARSAARRSREDKKDLEVLGRVVDSYGEGAGDPTHAISHGYLSHFLARFGHDSVPSCLKTTLLAAKDLREFVNYGPRILWQGSQPVFRSLEHATSESASVIHCIEALIADVLVWASGREQTAWARTTVLVVSLKDFLTQEDLLYARWCSKQVRDEALRMARRLPSVPQLHQAALGAVGDIGNETVRGHG